MVNIHVSRTGYGNYVEIKTLDYMSPWSLVKLTYILGDSPEQIKYLKVGYINGRLTVRSKNPIPKKAQSIITNLLANYGPIQLSKTHYGSTSDRNFKF